MADYQLNGWKYADKFGVSAAIKDQGHPLRDAPQVSEVTLDIDAQGFEVDVTSGALSDSDVIGSSRHRIELGENLKIGGRIFAKGSRIQAQYSFRTGGSNPIILIIALIGVADGAAKHPSACIVLTTTDLKPGQKLSPASFATSTRDGPSKNCFARGTLIDTPHGARPIDQLEDGDEILAIDGGVTQISWIGHRRVSGVELSLDPKLQPVRIMAGALAGGRPGQDLIVSQNHRLLVDDWRAPYLFGEDEILVPAKSLLNDTNVMQECPLGGIDYYHLLMQEHGMVCANGLWAESMVRDAETVAKLNPAQQSEIARHLPGKPDNIRAFMPALPHHSHAWVAA